MCWSFQVSFATWAIAFVCSIVLMRRGHPNDYSLGMLLLFYSSIQLWEALMWLDQAGGTLNLTATYLAYFALYSHAFAIGLGLYAEYRDPIPLVIGSLSLLVGVVQLFRLPRFTPSFPASDCGHLKWGFQTDFYKWIFYLAMVLALVYMRPIQTALMAWGVFAASFAFAYLFFAKGGVATMWCFIAAIAGPLFLWLN
jgi:hypothetical protein